jgi:hypothetical protein
MAKREVYEVTDPQRLLDTETGVWRAEIDTASDHAAGYSEEKGWQHGDVVVLTTRTYVDADRAGFVGYTGHQVTLPVCVVLELADAIRAGEVPRAADD